MPDIDGIDGYTTGRSLGTGPLGELWLAREDATGDTVTLRRLETDAEGQERARRLYGHLDGFRHPGLVRIREMIPVDDDMIVVSDYHEGGTLAELLNVRAMLDPGEVVSLAAPLARVLEVAHNARLIHGSVSPEAIWFTPDGRPLLADLGLAGVLDPERPQVEGDIFAMSAICYTALTGLRPGPGQPRRPLYMVAPGAPPGLAHVIEAGLQVSPENRPDARELADQIEGSTPAAPIRMPQQARPEAPNFPPPAPPTFPSGPGPHGHAAPPVHQPGHQPVHQPPQQPLNLPPPLRTIQVDDYDDERGSGKGGPLLWSALAFLLVAVLAGVGVWVFTSLGGESPPVVQGTRDPSPSLDTGQSESPTPTPVQTLTPDEWLAILDELDQVRTAAFEAMDPNLLSEVDVPDSEAYGKDSRDIAALQSENVVSATDVQQEFSNPSVMSQTETRAVVEVDVLSSPTIVAYQNGNTTECGQNPSQRQAIVFERASADEDWRISVRSPRDGTSAQPICPPAESSG